MKTPGLRGARFEASQGGIVSFEYDVDGETYQKTRYASSLRRDWREGPKTATVVYLRMLPSRA